MAIYKVPLKPLWTSQAKPAITDFPPIFALADFRQSADIKPLFVYQYNVLVMVLLQN